MGRRGAHFPYFSLLSTAASYRWPCRLLMDSVLSEPICPERRIAAGSSTTTYRIKVHMAPITAELSVGQDEDLTIHNDVTTSVATPTVETRLDSLAGLAGQ
eukprot:49800-Pyramimonas_sp.AAC.1